MSILFTFPPELKVHLFKSFTPYELLQMCLVSRQWKAMMETVGSFKRELGIVSQYTETNTAFNSVKLSNRRFSPEPPLLSPDGAHFLSTIFPNITKATLDLDVAEYNHPNCFNASGLLRDWAPNLTSLDFNLNCLQFDFALANHKFAQLLVTISSLPSLTHLHLTNMSTFQLSGTRGASFRLEELQLNGYYNCENLTEGLHHQVRRPSLRSFAIENLPDSSIDRIKSTITKLPSSLADLVITETEVSGTSFFAILRRLQELTFLNLAAVSLFNEIDFFDVAAIFDQFNQPERRPVSLNTFQLSDDINLPDNVFPAYPAVRELNIKRDGELDREMHHQLPSHAFPNVNKIAAHDDVHQVRRFFHIDVSNYRILKNIDLGQIGKIEDTGLWNSDEEEDYDADDEDDEEDG